MRKRRDEIKNKESQMSGEERARVIEKRRQDVRERVRKHREKKISAEKESEVPYSKVNKNGYSCKQTLCKAAKKVERALPSSPTKKKAVLAKIIQECYEDDRNNILDVSQSPQNEKDPGQNIDLIMAIQNFFQRDDISRTSPRVKDVKQYKCPQTGETVFMPKKHMTLTIKESYALFIEERSSEQKELCSVSFFNKNRPRNVELISDLPHDMCLCQYHANFIQAVDAFAKIVPDFPTYNNGFVQKFLCKNATKDCWYGKCAICTGISTDQLKIAIGNIPLNSYVQWKVWKKSYFNKRIEKMNEEGTLSDLVVHIVALSPKFLTHSFVKTTQSNTFNLFDIPRASDIKYSGEGTLQVDFAENFVCEAQDEVQSAHWNQRQLSLFTTSLQFNALIQSKVFVSDSLVHTKETIIPYIYKLLFKLPKNLKVLKIWSDGPSSQFKNKYIAAMIPKLESTFDLKIYWNYFAASHGKGCVDGIGAITKSIVRKHVRARESIVNCAADFVEAFHRTQSNILLEEMTELELSEINNFLDTSGIFQSAKNVCGIAAAHQIQVIDGKITTFDTSKTGYE